MPNVGPLELAVVVIIALIVFGPKRLPELGRSMGKGIREFRSSISGNDDEDKDDAPDVEEADSGAAATPSAEPTSSATSSAEPVEGEVVENRT
jgi:sec-independent protein translocase protein TatA